MKNVWIAILSAILAAAVAVGVVFAVQGLNEKKTTDKNNTSYSIQFLDNEYDVGDSVVYNFVVYSDIQFKALSYKLSNGEEKSIENVKFGISEDLSNVEENVGKYYADTKVQLIDTALLSDGYYTLVFYGYDKDNNRYEITKTPYAFRLNAVETSAAA